MLDTKQLPDGFGAESPADVFTIAVVPGVSSQQSVLFKTDRAAAVLNHLLASTTGVELAGGPVIGTQYVTCHNVWDEHGTFYPDSCPD